MAGAAEEAFRVALQTATAAAQAATAALDEVKRSQAVGLASKPKELELTGRPEEDRRLWSDWKFAAVQYLMTKDMAYQEEIERHIRSENQVRMDQLSEAEKGRSRQLFSFLAGTAKGRLLALMREDAVASNSNGFEAIRRIQRDIEPTSGAAALGLLETIMEMPTPPKGTPLRDAIMSMERLFVDYEATSGQKLSEHLKIATLRRLLPPELRVHVNLLVKDDSDYQAIKKAVSEYEVADRRYEPLKPETVFDHGGVVPMEVDQIKGGGKSKGGKGQSKAACKTCGKSHQGQCWFKDNQSAKAKGKGKSSKGGKGGKPPGGDASKEKCQICGKTNHTAEKCYQRYKEKDAKTSKVQAATTSPGTGGTSQSGTGGSVAALSHREVDTSPETELRVQTTGVRSVTAKGQGLALLDSGSDEHMCPANFAPWVEAETLARAPRLRDAQGAEIRHQCQAKTVSMRLQTDDKTHLSITVTFLIGPVKQPILSLGKLCQSSKASFEVGTQEAEDGRLLFKGGKYSCSVKKLQHSYYLPFFIKGPKSESSVSQIQGVKMLYLDQSYVKFREKLGKEPVPSFSSEQEEEEEEEKEEERAKEKSPPERVKEKSPPEERKTRHRRKGDHRSSGSRRRKKPKVHAKEEEAESPTSRPAERVKPQPREPERTEYPKEPPPPPPRRPGVELGLLKESQSAQGLLRPQSRRNRLLTMVVTMTPSPISQTVKVKIYATEPLKQELTAPRRTQNLVVQRLAPGNPDGTCLRKKRSG